MQRVSVSASSLSLLEGICYLSRDKGDCGVSVYSAVLIASPLKDPTYSTLIDNWQHTEGGLLECFWRHPSVGIHASICLLCSFGSLSLSKQQLSHMDVICVENVLVTTLHYPTSIQQGKDLKKRSNSIWLTCSNFSVCCFCHHRTEPNSATLPPSFFHRTNVDIASQAPSLWIDSQLTGNPSSRVTGSSRPDEGWWVK